MTSLRDKFTNIRRSPRGKRHTKNPAGAEGTYARAGDESDCHCSICEEADREWDELLDEVDELRVAINAKNVVLKELGQNVMKLEKVVERLVEEKLEAEGVGGGQGEKGEKGEKDGKGRKK